MLFWGFYWLVVIVIYNVKLFGEREYEDWLLIKRVICSGFLVIGDKFCLVDDDFVEYKFYIVGWDYGN